jgi:hypothetical protein
MHTYVVPDRSRSERDRALRVSRRELDRGIDRRAGITRSNGRFHENDDRASALEPKQHLVARKLIRIHPIVRRVHTWMRA